MATPKLTAKQKLAMLVDENEMPQKSTPKQSGTAVAEKDSREDPDHGLSQAQKDYWEGVTDDEDTAAPLTSNGSRSESPMGKWPPKQPSNSEFASITGNDKPHYVPPMGTAATAGESFVPIVALSKLPYKFIGNKTLGQRIASAFFDQTKFWRYHWEICYVWPSNANFSEVLLLVSTYQVECLISSIKEEITSCPSLMAIEAAHGLILTFKDPHPDLRPRYLGRITSQEEFNQIKNNVPNSSFRPDGESRDVPPPNQESKHAFKLLIEQGSGLARGKGKSRPKAVRDHQMFTIQQDHKQDLKEAERFFGLRPAYFDEQADANEPWSVSVARDARREAAAHPPSIDPSQLPLYPFASNVVLIAVDVESYERDSKKITEIGVSTLDTLDLVGIAPELYGSGWRDKIRSRHFRIKEHAHLMNGDFVAGNAGDFRFGESEFIDLDEAPMVLATCFRFPFSATKDDQQRIPEGTSAEDKRTIVLVGHDFGNDIQYMRNLGYDVTNLSNLSKHAPILDTQGMYRVMKGDKDPAKLAKLLEEIDVIPWGLHNAGNDARYTMEASIGIVVDKASQRTGKKTGSVDAIAEKVDRLSMQ